jgi:uncharacterized protein (TIGR03083 family)
MLRAPDPILVLDLFPSERRELLGLLDALPTEAWSLPSIAGEWTVKDIAAHLVGADLGRLSRQRDGHRESRDADEDLKTHIDRRNAEWVTSMRRISPRVLRSLLAFGGNDSQEFFATQDPFELGSTVSWAGPDPAPNWLDLAREFTERWHHQQQIRDAVGAPSLDDPRFLKPVLATFAFALRTPYLGVDAPEGTTVGLVVEGPSGGDWTIARTARGWELLVGQAEAPTASVRMNEDTAWRMYVGALSRAAVEDRSSSIGEAGLAGHLLDAFALVS